MPADWRLTPVDLDHADQERNVRFGWDMVADMSCTQQPGFGDFKHRDRPYQSGRPKHWIKIKNRKHHAFARVQHRR
jgi:hypothetical protein